MGLSGEIEVVDDVAGAFAAFVRDAAPKSIALSGGELAAKCYAQLAAEPLDWSDIDVYVGDERWLPVTDLESNEGMARAVLLDAARPKAVHSMLGAAVIEDAAQAYDALLSAAGPIDLVHLGLGPDGHTASLFPGSPALDVQDRLVVATGDDRHPYRRLTLTFPAIAQAKLALVTVEGEEKREAIARIRAGEDLPGARIRAERVVWLGDAAALGA